MSWKQTREFSQVIESLTRDRFRVTLPGLIRNRLPVSWKQTRGFSQVIESLTRGPLPRNLVHRYTMETIDTLPGLIRDRG
jgi:hypothetical protein